MSPEEFSTAITQLLTASGLLIALPLEEMAEYVEQVEALGAQPEMASLWTEERQQNTTQAGRLIAAATHLRTTARLLP